MNHPEVFIVDDDPAVRDSLVEMLHAAGLGASAFESGDVFLESTAGSRAACILLDIRMPGRNGIEVLEELGRRCDPTPVIVLTGHGDVNTAVRGMKLGAFDFIEKPFEAGKLLETIRQAIDHGTGSSLREAVRSRAATRLATLTAREREVFDLVISGDTSQQIGLKLHVSKKTVDTHRVHIMKKIGVGSVADLVRLAIRAGYEAESREPEYK